MRAFQKRSLKNESCKSRLHLKKYYLHKASF
jgi:hypothetical protein